MSKRLLVVVFLMCNALVLLADVNWVWRFGSEKGTFTTDGTIADAQGSFSFTITDFQVSLSSHDVSLIGATYTESQPTQGFMWDGSTPTQFFRDSGALTNGSNFYHDMSFLAYRFALNGGPVGTLTDNLTPVIAETALQLIPIDGPFTTDWVWSFASELGTLATDGSLDLVSEGFRFSTNEFQVVKSAFGGKVEGAPFTMNLAGFEWDGVNASEFFSDGGTVIGATFVDLGNIYSYLFDMNVLIPEGRVDVAAKRGEGGIGPAGLTLLPSAYAGDLNVMITPAMDTFCEGDSVLLSFTVAHQVGNDLDNISLMTHLPSGLTRTATAPSVSQGAYNEQSGLWDIGTLNNPQTAQLQLEVTLDSGASAMSQPLTVTTSDLMMSLVDINTTNNTGLAEMTVLQPIEISQSPSNQSLCSGEMVEFIVTASGGDPLNYQWFKDGLPLVGEVFSNFMIASLTVSDTGLYHCVITYNSSGRGLTHPCPDVATEPVLLNVYSELALESSPMSPVAQGLSPLTLSASAFCGTPAYVFEWLDLNQATSFGLGVNPILLSPAPNETTDYQVTVEDDLGEMDDFVVRVLVSENPAYLDCDGDGCNTIADIWCLATNWRMSVADDPNGDGLIDIRDFLFINTDDSLPCMP